MEESQAFSFVMLHKKKKKSKAEKHASPLASVMWAQAVTAEQEGGSRASQRASDLVQNSCVSSLFSSSFKFRQKKKTRGRKGRERGKERCSVDPATRTGLRQWARLRAWFWLHDREEKQADLARAEWGRRCVSRSDKWRFQSTEWGSIIPISLLKPSSLGGTEWSGGVLACKGLARTYVGADVGNGC